MMRHRNEGTLDEYLGSLSSEDENLDPRMREYMKAAKTFDRRNFKSERKKLRDEVGELQSTTKISSMARKGHNVLDQVRSTADQHLATQLRTNPKKV